jgi:hypothetical protein
MEQKKLYEQLYKRLANIDSDIADTFKNRCFENDDYMNLEYRINTFQFTVSKKIMIDDYFFWLNTAIENRKKEIYEINEIIRQDSISEHEEWLKYNEETDEWE